MHNHERPNLGIVLDGEISKGFSTESVVLRPNSGIAMPAGILHTDFFGGGSRVLTIELDPNHPLSEERLVLCRPAFENWMKVEDQRLTALAQRISNELARPDGATSLAVDGLIGETLSVVARSTARALSTDLPDWLREARDIARTNLHRRVSVTEIADAVGVHPAYLARRFRSEFGVTPGAFARNARLEQAAEQLQNSDRPIAEIAIQTGFSDQSHFTRAFRQYVDQTPAQFRERYRQIEGTPQ